MMIKVAAWLLTVAAILFAGLYLAAELICPCGAIATFGG